MVRSSRLEVSTSDNEAGYWHSNVWSTLPQETQVEWMNRLTSWKENGEVRGRILQSGLLF